MRKLAGLAQLSDPQMVNELNTHMLRAGAPSPSVETILHAILPHKYVDHTHADAVLAVSNAPDGEKRIREIYGERVVVIPYIMAGFDLAAYCAREFPKQARQEHRRHGAALARRLLFRRGRARVLRADDRARLDGGGVPRSGKRPGTSHFPRRKMELPRVATREDIAQLRRAMSDQAGFPMVLTTSMRARSSSASRSGPMSRSFRSRVRPRRTM